MASHGAVKERAATQEPASRKVKKELDHIRLSPAENGGAAAEHHFTSYEHKPEMHVFGAGDGPKLAAHLSKHLGLNLPGKSGTDSAESEEQKT